MIQPNLIAIVVLLVLPQIGAGTPMDFDQPESDSPNVSEQYFRSILRSKSSDELSQTIERAKRVEHSRLVCQTQLETERIPIACFGNSSIQDARQEDLGSICVRRATESKNRDELEQASRLTSLPSGCRAAAQERLGDLHYSLQTVRPQMVIERSLPTRSR